MNYRMKKKKERSAEKQKPRKVERKSLKWRKETGKRWKEKKNRNKYPHVFHSHLPRAFFIQFDMLSAMKPRSKPFSPREKFKYFISSFSFIHLDLYYFFFFFFFLSTHGSMQTLATHTALLK